MVSKNNIQLLIYEKFPVYGLISRMTAICDESEFHQGWCQRTVCALGSRIRKAASVLDGPLLRNLCFWTLKRFSFSVQRTSDSPRNPLCGHPHRGPARHRPSALPPCSKFALNAYCPLSPALMDIRFQEVDCLVELSAHSIFGLRYFDSIIVGAVLSVFILKLS